MAKKPFGVSALSQALDDKKSASIPEEPVRSKPGKTVSSPINSPAMTVSTQRIQRLYLDLPVSKTRVECELMELDPGQCIASVFNKRIQSLLTDNNPSIQQLKKSISEEGQRDPVLVRPVQDKGGATQYEVVYGTRRRYVTELLGREGHENIKLRAWVSGKIPDADAKRLADSENEDRQDISAWEIAKYFEGLKGEHPDWSDDTIAALEGVNQTTVTRYLQLAAMPESVVKLVASPNEISLRAGLDILKMIKPLTSVKRESVISTLHSTELYPTAADLLKAIKDLTQIKPKVPSKKSKVEIMAKTGKRRAVIGSHRSQKGQYKVDLFDVSEQELESLTQALSKLFSK